MHGVYPAAYSDNTFDRYFKESTDATKRKLENNQGRITSEKSKAFVGDLIGQTIDISEEFQALDENNMSRCYRVVQVTEMPTSPQSNRYAPVHTVSIYQYDQPNPDFNLKSLNDGSSKLLYTKKNYTINAIIQKRITPADQTGSNVCGAIFSHKT